MELAPGTMVTPNVRLRRPLREGGMGHVWLAEHLTLKLDVAVKFISRKLATDDPRVIARFEQEARTAAHIKSDHVVQTHDCGIMPDGTPYLVMELLEGESLQDHIDRVGRLSLRDLGRVVLQIAKALGRAHKIGIVHRDIKPANIFLCTTDEGLHVKVLDFGVARPAAPPGTPGSVPGSADEADEAPGETIVGTLPFLSPEQFAGLSPVDNQVDLWALGVLAYRCLTGRFPFTGQTPGLLCVSVMSGEFPRPSAICGPLPPGLDDWFGRALHRVPSQRFPSAREMALALTRAIPSTAEDFDDERSAIVYPGATARGSSPGQVGMLESGPSLVLASRSATLGRRKWAQPVAIAAVFTSFLVLGATALVLLRSPSSPGEGDARSAATAMPNSAAASGAAPDGVARGPEEADLDAGEAAPSGSAPLPPAVGDAGPAISTPPGSWRPGQAGPSGRRPKGREDYGF